jgi:DNA-binding IclR family transcriptional regulator
MITTQWRSDPEQSPPLAGVRCDEKDRLVTTKRKPAPDRSVSAAERTMAILNALTGQKGPVSLTELESRTGLFKSVILRYLITLTRERMVTKLSDGPYRLGTKVLALAHSYEQSIDYLDVIRPSVERLAAETSETASFYVRDGDMRICLLRKNSPHGLRVNLRQGDTAPLDETSTGQVLRQAETTPTVDGCYIRQTLGLVDTLTTSIAIPIFGAREALIGALTLSGPIGRFQPSAPAVRKLLYEEAAKLSVMLGSVRHYLEPFDGTELPLPPGTNKRGSHQH